MKFASSLVLVAALSIPFTAVSQTKPNAPQAPQQQQPQPPQETPAQQQISKQGQAIVNDMEAAQDQINLYKRIERDQQQLQQLDQQYQQAGKTQAPPTAAPATK